MSDNIRKRIDLPVTRSVQLMQAYNCFLRNNYNPDCPNGKGFEDLNQIDKICCYRIAYVYKSNSIVQECINEYGGLKKLVDKMEARAKEIQGAKLEESLQWINVQNAAQELIQECEEKKQKQGRAK